MTAGKPPEKVRIDEDRLRKVMGLGGRAEVTVRSLKSGQHVHVVLVAKKRKAGGGYVSRAQKAGRVGIREADAVYCNDSALDFHESGLARLIPASGRVYVDAADQNRGWIAQMLLHVANGARSFPESAEVFLATRCCSCGKKLWDPESVEDGIGPECKGKATGSKSLPQQQAMEVAA